MLLRELFYKTLNEATLRRGSRGDEVKAMQRALGIRPADGIFGPATERAVRNFQTAAKITVDGIAGGQTQAAIRKFAEEPGASSDYGQIRPGTDWSALDPGEIELTLRQEPAAQEPAAQEPTGVGRGDGGAEAARRAADNNGQPRGSEADVMSQQVAEPENGWQDVDPQFAQGLPDGYQIKRGRVDGEDMFLLIRPNGTEETSNDLQGLIRVAQADIEADQERAAGAGIDGRDAQRAQGMGIERPADPASTMRDNEIEGTGQWRITPSPNNPTTFVVRRPDGSIDTSFNNGNPFTRSKADGEGQQYIDRLNREQGTADEPEVTGSGRGDGNAEVAARREEAARQATEEFVRAQVAELTRVRATMPNDQLIQTITQRAVEQGLNNNWRERGAMAAYIAELVPTVDRTTPTPTASTDSPTLQSPEVGGDSEVQRPSTTTTPGGSNQAVSGLGGVQEPEAAPSVDSATATAQQISRFQQAYGSGSDGQLPALFRDRFLNPALNYQQNSPAEETQSLNAMKALQAELAGEIPQAVARVTIERMLQSDFGGEVRGEATFSGLINELKGMVQELQGDPELRTQAEYYQIKLAVIEKLMQDMARPNESVELDRIKMLAGV